MENLVFGGQQAPSAAYDYRVYDQVWKRVSPGLDPYAENPAGAGQPSGAAGAPVPPAMPRSQLRPSRLRRHPRGWAQRPARQTFPVQTGIPAAWAAMPGRA